MISCWSRSGASASPCRLFWRRCATRTCAPASVRSACSRTRSEMKLKPVVPAKAGTHDHHTGACVHGFPLARERLKRFRNAFALTAFALIAVSAPAHAQLRGHGGPVRAVAVAPDGKTALSGSFDSSAIRWSLERNAAERVLRFHDSAVNAVAVLPDGKLVTAGEDGRIALWSAGDRPDVLTGHEGPVVALSVSPDGRTLASAAWDQTVRLWPLAGGAPRADGA